MLCCVLPVTVKYACLVQSQMNVALLQHATHPSMGRVMGQVRVRVIRQVKERLKENVGLLAVVVGT